MKSVERIASWQRNPSAIVTFRYNVNGLDYQFGVTQENKRSVIAEIGKLAANPVCEMDYMDAEYLTSLIREVMSMQPEACQIECNCDRCTGANHLDLLWSLMMFVCSGAFLATAAVFILWGVK